MGEFMVPSHIDSAGDKMGTERQRAFRKGSSLHHCGKSPKFYRYFR